uniref:Uncharacterized protein n=1 Tax=Arundo donax TaxID=35708 RepID=A0A0A9ACM7_ARUDO
MKFLDIVLPPFRISCRRGSF